MKLRQKQLKKVLIALANTDKEIGYIQGLNVFASTFLINDVCDHDAYWIAKYFLKKMKLKDVMKSEFPKLKLLTYQMDVFLYNYLPEIRDHFVEYFKTLSELTYILGNTGNFNHLFHIPLVPHFICL